jgi:hypothetical protein
MSSIIRHYPENKSISRFRRLWTLVNTPLSTNGFEFHSIRFQGVRRSKNGAYDIKSNLPSLKGRSLPSAMASSSAELACREASTNAATASVAVTRYPSLFSSRLMRPSPQLTQEHCRFLNLQTEQMLAGTSKRRHDPADAPKQSIPLQTATSAFCLSFLLARFPNPTILIATKYMLFRGLDTS